MDTSTSASDLVQPLLGKATTISSSEPTKTQPSTTDAPTNESSVQPTSEPSKVKSSSKAPKTSNAASTNVSSTSEDKSSPVDASDFERLAKEARSNGVSLEEFSDKYQTPVGFDHFDLQKMPEIFETMEKSVTDFVIKNGKDLQSLSRACSLFMTLSPLSTKSPMQKAAVRWLKSCQECQNEALKGQAALKRLLKASLDGNEYLKLDPQDFQAVGEEALKKSMEASEAQVQDSTIVLELRWKVDGLDQNTTAAREDLIKEHSKVCQCSLPYCMPALLGIAPGVHVLWPFGNLGI